MVETVFLDWGLSFGAGLLFALAGWPAVRAARNPFATRPFAFGLLYLHAGVLAISLTLYAMDRDWMWMYWVDARHLPIGVQALVFVLYEVCFLAGFAFAAFVARKAAVAVAVAVAAAITVLEVSARARLLHFGTIRQFASGTARSFTAAWWVAYGAGAASTLALVVLLVTVWRKSPAA